MNHFRSSFLAFLTFTLASSFARADPRDGAVDTPTPDRAAARAENVARLSAFASTGYLGSSGASGGAFATGVRLALGRHFALGFDLGYGLIATQTILEDRWWLIPSMAVVLPARIGSLRPTFDLGAGFGWGTSSGYKNWSEYAAQPFSADWAYQLVPTFRVHAIASLPLTSTVDVFARAEAAAMVMPDDTHATATDTTWFMFSIGTRFDLL